MTPEEEKDFHLRYCRQISVSEIGMEGQQKLFDSGVFIIGCGALGSMVAMQLAGAGIGKLGIADFDVIEISNLQRQFFFRSEERGERKVQMLFSRIKDLNPQVEVESYPSMVTRKMAEGILEEYDFIVDATDNPESKKMIGEIAKSKRKPCCIAGVNGFGGQVITLLPNDSRFGEFFGDSASEGILPCSLGGVIGPAAALCASIQAAETIKFIIGKGELLSGKLLTFNLLTASFKTFTL